MRTYSELTEDRDNAADRNDWALVDAIERQIDRGDYVDGPDCAYLAEREAFSAYDALREHLDHEGNAAYDRYDGWVDPYIGNDVPGCPVCGYREDCEACVAAAEDYADMLRAEYAERMERAACAACDDDIPF